MIPVTLRHAMNALPSQPPPRSTGPTHKNAREQHPSCGAYKDWRWLRPLSCSAPPFFCSLLCRPECCLCSAPSRCIGRHAQAGALVLRATFCSAEHACCWMLPAAMHRKAGFLESLGADLRRMLDQVSYRVHMLIGRMYPPSKCQCHEHDPATLLRTHQLAKSPHASGIVCTSLELGLQLHTTPPQLLL